MNTVIGLFGDLWNALRCVGELFGYLLRFVSVFFRSRTSLVAPPHRGLDGDTPIPIPQPKVDVLITGPTKLLSTPILGGLHHRYQRVAA